YEMLVGEPPFTGSTAQAIIARHSLDSVSPPSIVRAAVPDTVERGILRALAKVPADRYPTTALFAEALAAPGTPVGVAARRTTRAIPAARWIGLPRGGVLAGVAVLVAIAGWGVLALVRGRARPQRRHARPGQRGGSGESVPDFRTAGRRIEWCRLPARKFRSAQSQPARYPRQPRWGGRGLSAPAARGRSPVARGGSRHPE